MPRIAALVLLACVLASACRSTVNAAVGQAAPPVDFNVIAARVDPYVEKSRVLVMSDIANEPDDQMSMVRFLVVVQDDGTPSLTAYRRIILRSDAAR